MSPRRRVAAAAGFFVVTFAAACSGGMSPGAPSATPPAPSPILNVAGTWTGTSTDSQGVTVVEWTFTQTGTAVTGIVRTHAPDPTDGSCNSCHRNKSGTFSGTMNGPELSMSMRFAAGADGDPTPACSATMTGTATGNASGQLAGRYTGSDTCEGSFLDGSLTMTRR